MLLVAFSGRVAGWFFFVPGPPRGDDLGRATITENLPELGSIVVRKVYPIVNSINAWMTFLMLDGGLILHKLVRFSTQAKLAEEDRQVWALNVNAVLAMQLRVHELIF